MAYKQSKGQFASLKPGPPTTPSRLRRATPPQAGGELSDLTVCHYAKISVYSSLSSGKGLSSANLTAFSTASAARASIAS